MTKIPKGCVFLARKLCESDIWNKKPGWWLKVWIHLLFKVNYKDNGKLKRGQGFFTRETIHTDCGLYLDAVKAVTVDNVIRWLRATRQITTKKASHGVIVTICNYEGYQNLDNYKFSLSSHFEKTGFATTQKTAHETTQNSDDKTTIGNETENKVSNEIKTRQKRDTNETDPLLYRYIYNNNIINNTKNVKKEKKKNKTLCVKVADLSDISSLIKKTKSVLSQETKILVEEYLENARYENKSKKITRFKELRLCNELEQFRVKYGEKLLKHSLTVANNKQVANKNYVKKVILTAKRKQEVKEEKKREEEKRLRLQQGRSRREYEQRLKKSISQRPGLVHIKDVITKLKIGDQDAKN